MSQPSSSITPPLVRTASARIPTVYGAFFLHHYNDARDAKEHLALVMGDVRGRSDALVRVHSECMTGDTFGSLRCDCGEQLHMAMQRIASAAQGVIIYLRQEGRGIGLAQKLRAYNLQDEGYDTVDANLMLGHQADEREYWAAADILRDLGVESIQLLTNNPAKIEQLRGYGIQINGRVPLQPSMHADNAAYLQTKVARMRHLLQLPPAPPTLAGAALTPDLTARISQLQERSLHHFARTHSPHVTISYAQSLDGSLSVEPGAPLALSGATSMTMTHALRAAHDAILVGVGTVLADNPRLTVRLVAGANPQPVVLDSALRTPLDAALLNHPRGLWILTTERSSSDARHALAARGAEIVVLPPDESGRVSLSAALAALYARGVRSVMVEGGAHVLESFVASHLAHYAVITLAPRLVGGLHAYHAGSNGALPRLAQVAYTPAGEDLIVWGEPVWGQPAVDTPALTPEPI
ncbi:MAG: GTP cyclohydrolase-2 [Chloroflexota bacterium]|nr:GTP cyclohydrolase II [Caldilinea sp.]GIK71016.1 MAG: GTP cyclohydrolase-2 [Chloroflexota bacterium]